MTTFSTDPPPSSAPKFGYLCGETGLNSKLLRNTDPTPHPHRIEFETPAQQWVEALPLGNGILGAMNHSSSAREFITLNRHDAWSGNTKSPYQEPPAYTNKTFLQDVRDFVTADRIDHAEQLLKTAQSTHSQAFLPYFDVDITVHCEGIDPEPNSLKRSLDFSEARTQSTYLFGANRICHSTFIPRQHDSNASPFLVHVIENHGDAEVTARVAVTSLLRTHRVSDSEYLIEVPSDVAPTHEDVPEYVRYQDSRPRVGVLTIGQALLKSAGQDGLACEPAGEFSNAAPSRNQDGFELTIPAHQTLILVVGCPPIEPTSTVIGAHQAHRWPAIAADLAHRRETALHAAQQYAALLSTNLDAEFSSHVAGHRKLYDSQTLQLSALEVTRQYNFGRYLLISGYAPEANPLNLQGLWCHDIPAPWSSNYTLNINTPMNYWGVEAAGLPQVHTPLVSWLERVARGPGKSAAQNLYGLDGFVLHHNSDAWGHALPVGAGDGDASWAYWPMGGLWLTRHLWDHFEYSQDVALLERMWPVIESAGHFTSQWLEVHDGKARIFPSVSPENRYLWHGEPRSVSDSVTMDIALVKDFARYAAQSHQILFGSAAGLPSWLDFLVKAASLLPEYQVGSRGQILEWLQEFDEVEADHRHLSHLVGVYPLGSWHDRPELLEASAKSLTLRGDDSTGWSLAWRIALWARLGHNAMVADAVERSLRPALGRLQRHENSQDPAYLNEPENTEHRGGIYPNLFSAHPPFQIDGNLGFVAGILEAICFVQGNELVLLNGVPKAWESGTLRGVRLRAGATADISWNDSMNYSLRLTPTRNYSLGSITSVRTAHGYISLDLLPQQTVEITVENGIISAPVTIS